MKLIGCYRYYIEPRDILSLRNKNNMVKFWIIFELLHFFIGILAIFSNFGGNFCLIYSSSWFSDHFLAWNIFYPDMLSLRKKKYVEIPNNIWIIASYIWILANFSIYLVNFCLVHSSFARNHGRTLEKHKKLFKFENWWKFLKKTTKIRQILSKFGISRQIFMFPYILRLGETCSHVAAILYKVEAAVR